jgi:DNA replication protein DnaC
LACTSSGSGLLHPVALADNSVGRTIDTLLRNDLIICDELGFAPLDDTGAQLLFRFVAAAYERRSLGIDSHWPFESWGASYPSTPPPSACSTGSCTTATSSSPTATARRAG